MATRNYMKMLLADQVMKEGKEGETDKIKEILGYLSDDSIYELLEPYDKQKVKADTMNRLK